MKATAEMVWFRRNWFRRLSYPLAISSIGVTIAPTSAQAQPLPSIRAIPLPANALAWDPVHKKLYATVGSHASIDRANTLTTIDPVAGKVEKSVFMGSSEPDRPVVSAGGRHVYIRVGPLFRRYDVAEGQAGPYVKWEGDGFLKQAYAHPTDPEAVVLLLGGRSGFAGSETAVLSHGKLLPGRVKSGGEVLVPTIAPSFAYMDSRAIVRFGASGARLCWYIDRDGPFGNSGGMPIAGLLVNSSGFVYDQETADLLGNIPRNAPEMTLAVDPMRATILRLHDEKLSIYDLRTLRLIREIAVPGYHEGRNLTRWGRDGVAFTTGKEVVLISGDLGPVLNPVDLTLFRTALPGSMTPGSTCHYRLTVQNASHFTSSAVFLTDKLPDGIEISNVRASQGKATASDGLIRAALGSLKPGATVTVDVSFVVLKRDAAPEEMRFYAVVRGYEPDPIGDNNVSAVQLSPQ